MEWYWILLIIVLSLALLFLIISFILGGVMWSMAIPNKNPQAEREPNPKDPLEKEFGPYVYKMEARLKAMKMEEIDIRSFDGVRLHGYLRMADAQTNKFIISVHGRPGTAFKGAPQFSEWILNYNYNCLFLDLRSYGKSEGKYTTFGVFDYRDLMSWTNYLVDSFGDDSEICYMGLSMGCTTVLSTVDKVVPQVKCVIADCGFISPYEQFKYMLKNMYHLPTYILSFASFINKIVVGFGFKDINTLNTVKASRIPICFITGSEDTFVPTWMTKKNYDTCKSKKELHIFEGAPHARSYFLNKEKYESVCLDFLSKYF